MRDPESGNTKCVWHDALELFPDELTKEEELANQPNDALQVDEKLSAETIDTAADNGLAARGPILAGEATSVAFLARQSKREQSDMASRLIAKRMLQGWALIDQSCPNETCNSVPLVQDRDKMQQCVICEQQYMDEAAYVKKYGASPKTLPGSSVELANNSATLQAQAPRSPTLLVPYSPPTTTPAKAAVCSTEAKMISAERTREMETPVVMAMSALEAKLAQLSARLAGTTDCKKICAISKAMGACANAIRECQALKRRCP
ncbi:hypothetical protein GGI04_001746 [Coemansia thaxteri]|nr:hypothetical protein GGI04_001746 [Coemansia thaxteri]